MMNIKRHYFVEKISGDYAVLRQTDENCEKTEILVALALLPLAIFEGSKLIYENLEYTLE